MKFIIAIFKPLDLHDLQMIVGKHNLLSTSGTVFFARRNGAALFFVVRDLGYCIKNYVEPDGKFVKFMKLPIEVRLIIRDYTREGRYIPFRPTQYAHWPTGTPFESPLVERDLPYHGGNQRIIRATQYAAQTSTWKFPVPSLLHVCQESRFRTLETYRISLNVLPRVYFDLEIDGLYLNHSDIDKQNSHLYYFVYIYPARWRASIKRLLIETDLSQAAWISISRYFPNVESILMIRGGHDAFLKNKKGIVVQSELEERNLKPRDVLEEWDLQWVYLGETWLESYNNYMTRTRSSNVEDLLKNLKEIKLVDFVKGK